MIAVTVPGMLSYDAGSLDQMFRNLTWHFGLYSVDSIFTDPSYYDDGVIQRRGRGPSQQCQRSGNMFPQSRLRRDGQGRLVGDIFRTDGQDN